MEKIEKYGLGAFAIAVVMIASSIANTTKGPTVPSQSSIPDGVYNTGSVIKVVRKHMRDPESFRYEYAKYRGDWVCIKYRAKNGFGGYATGFTAANVKTGENANDDYDLWNKQCAGEGFFDAMDDLEIVLHEAALPLK